MSDPVIVTESELDSMVESANLEAKDQPGTLVGMFARWVLLLANEVRRMREGRPSEAERYCACCLKELDRENE